MSRSTPDQVLGEAAKLLDEYSGLRTQNAPALATSSKHSSAPSTFETNVQRKVTVQSAQLGQNLEDSGRNLAGKSSPNIQIASEKPEHRIMVYLKAQGYTNREIAQATGYTEAWISQITRQGWFKERLTAEIREAGLDPVKAFLSAEALPSLEVLTAIRDNENAPAASRITAANSVLDRVFGKPTQHIETESTVNVRNAKASADALEEELKSIDEQLRIRGQRTSTGN